MPDTFRCPRGHEWHPATADAACPECGAAGETVLGADDSFPGDELPPPPGTQPIPPGWTATPLPPDSPPVIDGYEVGEEVGRGGMAVVYRARQRSLNRSVALKVLLPGARASPGEAARIRAEAEAVARLQHPNVVHVYEVGEQGGCPYLLMEYVDGGTLADRLGRGPVPPAQAAAWAEAIARGVHAAHRRGDHPPGPQAGERADDRGRGPQDHGLRHRPPAGGVGLPTRTGVVMGTPAYMAPEQAEGRGKSAGPAADVWAVGAILYEMLTGRPPFAGGSAIDVLHGVVYEPAPPPSRLRAGVPPGLEAVCLKCLQKRPEDRYPSAEALADDLARWRTDPDAVVGPVRPARRRWVVPVAVTAVLAILALVVTGLSGWPGRPGSGPISPPGRPGRSRNRTPA